jgi:hypothetical protein
MPMQPWQAQYAQNVQEDTWHYYLTYAIIFDIGVENDKR